MTPLVFPGTSDHRVITRRNGEQYSSDPASFQEPEDADLQELRQQGHVQEILQGSVQERLGGHTRGGDRSHQYERHVP